MRRKQKDKKRIGISGVSSRFEMLMGRAQLVCLSAVQQPASHASIQSDSHYTKSEMPPTGVLSCVPRSTTSTTTQHRITITRSPSTAHRLPPYPDNNMVDRCTQRRSTDHPSRPSSTSEPAGTDLRILHLPTCFRGRPYLGPYS